MAIKWLYYVFKGATVTVMAKVLLYFFFTWASARMVTKGEQALEAGSIVNIGEQCKYWWTTATDKVTFINQKGYTLIIFSLYCLEFGILHIFICEI